MGMPEGLCIDTYIYRVYIVILNIAFGLTFLVVVSQPVLVKCIQLLEINHTKLKHTDLFDYT